MRKKSTKGECTEKKEAYIYKYAIEASATMSSCEVIGLVVSAVTSWRDLVEESIAWAMESQQDLTVIFIDFEKAFDWVN